MILTECAQFTKLLNICAIDQAKYDANWPLKVEKLGYLSVKNLLKSDRMENQTFLTLLHSVLK